MDLFPLARGNPAHAAQAGVGAGPIPARAGQPRANTLPCRATRAYPRSREATEQMLAARANDRGLSPLARGNHLLGEGGFFGLGPIPARAGQPARHASGPCRARAYPRSRGATYVHFTRDMPPEGLSPLARGNRRRRRRIKQSHGPIPARAGQPAEHALCAPGQWAYPRSRGATNSPNAREEIHEGLSPLARGNLQLKRPGHEPVGPIPARAGQPLERMFDRLARPAYPRSRGATNTCRRRRHSQSGLSPLARGNRRISYHHVLRKGPIPARAGQPGGEDGEHGAFRAYPRSRGATVQGLPSVFSSRGLSPLARGNLLQAVLERAGAGPIPARAGQPVDTLACGHTPWAYPRSRGATTTLTPAPSMAWGLSPLARGNRIARPDGCLRGGPIPARAGQPMSDGSYQPPCSGLSPLARGNHQAAVDRRTEEGPIPARAGQPAGCD